MPRMADHQERRERIAAALLRVAAAGGLSEVSLRRVAAEAGVTTGMVQHYFPSKDAMIECAMQAASAGFEARMSTAVDALGPEPGARRVVRAVLATLLPSDDEARADGRIALAFLAYAATRPPVAQQLEVGAAALRAHLADQLRAALTSGEALQAFDPEHLAVALLAVAEGLSVAVLSNNLPIPSAFAALDAQLDLILNRSESGKSPSAARTTK